MCDIYFCSTCEHSWRGVNGLHEKIACSQCGGAAKSLSVFQAETVSRRPAERVLAIRALNDRLRKTGEGGQIVISPAIQAKGAAFTAAATSKLRELAFEGNEPRCNEHDFAVVHGLDETLLFKIDYLDPPLAFEAADSSDAAECIRVLTLMTDGEAAYIDWD